MVLPCFRHHQPDHDKADPGHGRKPGEGDAAAELVADVTGEHGAQGGADAGRGADDALREIEATAAESRKYGPTSGVFRGAFWAPLNR